MANLKDFVSGSKNDMSIKNGIEHCSIPFFIESLLMKDYLESFSAKVLINESASAFSICLLYDAVSTL